MAKFIARAAYKRLAEVFSSCAVALLLGISMPQLTSFQPKSYWCSSLTPLGIFYFVFGIFKYSQEKTVYFCFIFTKSFKRLINCLGFQDELLSAIQLSCF